MAERSESVEGNPENPHKRLQGLRVPLPAVLVGLGMIATSAQQAEAAQANNDNYFVASNSVLTGVNILANDIVASNSFVVVVAGPASHGTALVDDLGNLTYTPNSGFVGTDTFSYVLADDQSNSAAQVSILVSAPPVAPTLGTAALVGLSGLLAYFGLRRRRQD